jgi:tRNA(Arg) A34 adenosine deaminase TadA
LTAALAWEALDPAWRETFEGMWEAWREGSIPVGAVLTDETGAIVRRARNRIFEDDPPPPQLSRSRLAHAELNLLVGLTSARTYEDWTLYTSLEPCLLCLGATYKMRDGRLRYAAADRYGGAVGRVRSNDDMRAHPLLVEGPLPGPLGLLAELLHVAFFLEHRPESNVVASYTRELPELVERARALLAASVKRAELLPDALDALWVALG